MLCLKLRLVAAAAAAEESCPEIVSSQTVLI